MWILAIWIYGVRGWGVRHLDYPDGRSCYAAVEKYEEEGVRARCWERVPAAVLPRSPENGTLEIPMVIK